jgi:hypothetical protein
METQKESHMVEWLNSEDCDVASMLCGEGILVYGCYHNEANRIHVYLDSILKRWKYTGFEPVEKWLTLEFTEVLIHELIHCLASDWSEEMVSLASRVLVGVMDR